MNLYAYILIEDSLDLTTLHFYVYLLINLHYYCVNFITMENVANIFATLHYEFYKFEL